MIISYHRPSSIDEALQLLGRHNSIPLAGGTYITTTLSKSPEPYSVVDIQDLLLDKISTTTKKITIGASAKLRQIIEFADVPNALKTAICLDANTNQRNSQSLTGAILLSDGRSAIAACLLALDTVLELEPGNEMIPLQKILQYRHEIISGKLITKIIFNSTKKLELQTINRTKNDFPILLVALAQIKVDYYRMVIGGFGSQPHLLIDGHSGDDLSSIARSACSQASDQWASAEYRSSVVESLVKRCLGALP